MLGYKMYQFLIDINGEMHMHVQHLFFNVQSPAGISRGQEENCGA